MFRSIKSLLIVSSVLTSSFLVSTSVLAQSVVQQWQQGLAGSRLTAYEGSAISNNSTLTVINFCRNGRYSYYKEGSWSVSGQAGGASQNQITGNWDVVQQGPLLIWFMPLMLGSKARFRFTYKIMDV